MQSTFLPKRLRDFRLPPIHFVGMRFTQPLRKKYALQNMQHAAQRMRGRQFVLRFLFEEGKMRHWLIVAEDWASECSDCKRWLSRLSISLSLARLLQVIFRGRRKCEHLSLLVSVLIVGLSYGARNVLPLSYGRRMMQNFLAFRESSIILLIRSHWISLGLREFRS